MDKAKTLEYARSICKERILDFFYSDWQVPFPLTHICLTIWRPCFVKLKAVNYAHCVTQEIALLSQRKAHVSQEARVMYALSLRACVCYWFKWFSDPLPFQVGSFAHSLRLDTLNFLLYDLFERHMRRTIILWLKRTSRTYLFSLKSFKWNNPIIILSNAWLCDEKYFFGPENYSIFL